jgi:glycosyltransferase involved in cell wall biosynthesis
MLGDLAFHLAGRGWEVAVITSRQRYDDPRARLPARERVRNVEIHRIRTTRFGRMRLLGRAIDYLTFSLGALRLLRRTLQPGDIVVALTDPPLISVVASWATAARKAKLMNWVQDLFPEVAERLGTLKRGMFVRFLTRLRNRSLRRARMNVVIGESMEKLLGSLGVPTHVRPNWADGSAIRPLAHDSNALRKEWAPGQAFVVGYSGNLGRAHEFDTMIRAAEELRDDDRVRFLIIGSGPRLQTVQRAVEQKKLVNVMFRPYQPRERLPESLGAADAHLISLDPAVEGMIVPSKFYGIAAAGRAAIYIGDTEGEIPRILSRDDCGVAVPAGDSKALANAIRLLAADPDRARQMGQNSRRLFEQSYDAPIAFADWERVLETVSGP